MARPEASSILRGAARFERPRLSVDNPNIVNVVSPGGFPNTLTAEALLEGRSEIRNRVIARVFKELGYIEQWGSGIQRIKSACLAQGLVEPRIREKGDFVDVEFYRPATAGAVPDSAGQCRNSAGYFNRARENYHRAYPKAGTHNSN